MSVLLLPAFALNGFVDLRAGGYFEREDYLRAQPLSEARLQLEQNYENGWTLLKFRGDFIYDDIKPEETNIAAGTGSFDLREVNAAFWLHENIDLKVGRQILTWGTGDLLFINDLFPKDWRSFLIGRDNEYLKAPADAVKIGYYSGLANIDLIYFPDFNSDRYLTGLRTSFWNPNFNSLVGKDHLTEAKMPRQYYDFDDDEVAARIYKNIFGYEAALYGYRGFWKSPAGQDADGYAIFPRLKVYGASLRGNLLNGIANLEYGEYYSVDDIDGDNLMIDNGQWRFLAGYEQELWADLTIGLQYYTEKMMDYEAYGESLFPGMERKDQVREVQSVRLTQQLLNQNLMISTIYLYSPTDLDHHWRTNGDYKVNDDLTVGASVISSYGRDENTFYSQFQKNSAAYLSLRYGF